MDSLNPENPPLVVAPERPPRVWGFWQTALRAAPQSLERVLDQCLLATSAELGLLQPLLEADSASLRRDVERLVHVVAASLLAAQAPGIVVDAYVRTRLEGGGSRRYSLDASEIDVLIARAMPEI